MSIDRIFTFGDSLLEQNTDKIILVVIGAAIVLFILIVLSIRPILKSMGERMSLENKQIADLQTENKSKYERILELENERKIQILKIEALQAQVESWATTIVSSLAAIGNIAFVRDNIGGIYNAIEVIETFISQTTISVKEESERKDNDT